MMLQDASGAHAMYGDNFLGKWLTDVDSQYLNGDDPR